ncbi:hypothetical protein FIA58_007875 [Flavobacterium jejuense]|uniref:Uncharacterized protein n=1 Tax=Flavobacterium jejuense TaxID=1544455 RepID=A0ABX0IP58_9FLAO|nr:hypothetical protein [Flavobacterium jejuense]NHN25592.1 hypothetical protein [Flavobacterium jejuense]
MSPFLVSGIVLSIGFFMMFYMMKKNKNHVNNEDLEKERVYSDQYQKELLEKEYPYIKKWMKNASIDAFTSASIPYTGMDRAKDIGKDVLKSAMTLGTVKYTTVETPSFVVLSEGKMHYFSTDVEGDLKEHLIFNAERLNQAIVTLDVKKSSENATSKAKESMGNKYLFTFDIEGQKSTIAVHNTLIFNADITSMFGNNYSNRLTKNQVVGEQFYTKISSLYPNLKAKS